MIAAIVLGVLAVAALAFAFGPGMFSSGTSATSVKVTVSPSPGTAASPTNPDRFRMPTQADQDFGYATTPVNYRPEIFDARDAGRNIFAFYEPPPPTPWSPTPYIAPTIKPTPTPTPFPFLIGFVQPQMVYAGSRGFRLDINGDQFTPDVKIYFNQTLLPTTYVGPQRLTADVPANFITREGPRQVILQTVDGTKHSNQVMFQVQPPPKPQVVYIGMVTRKYANNDTAYFMDQNKVNTAGATPTAHRLNDVVGGRFRLVSISTREAVLEDTQLGFRHPLPLQTAPTGGGGGSGPAGFPNRGFPSSAPTNTMRPGSVPGFPNVTFPQRPNNANRPAEKKDEDEDDDDPNRR